MTYMQELLCKKIEKKKKINERTEKKTAEYKKSESPSSHYTLLPF